MDFPPKLQFCNQIYDFALIPEIEISRVLQLVCDCVYNMVCNVL